MPEVHHNLIFISSSGQTSTERKGRWEQARENSLWQPASQTASTNSVLPHLPPWKQLSPRFLSLQHAPSLPMITIKISKRSQSLHPFRWVIHAIDHHKARLMKPKAGRDPRGWSCLAVFKLCALQDPTTSVESHGVPVSLASTSAAPICYIYQAECQAAELGGNSGPCTLPTAPLVRLFP